MSLKLEAGAMFYGFLDTEKEVEILYRLAQKKLLSLASEDASY